MKRAKSLREFRGGGFTLIELMVSLAITAVVGVFLTAFIGPQLKMYDAFSQQSSAKSACAGVLNALQEKIEFGRDFSLNSDTLAYTLVTADGEEAKTVNGTALAGQLFPNQIRGGKQFDISFALEDDTVEITVSVLDAGTGDEIYGVTQSIYCPNMGLHG